MSAARASYHHGNLRNALIIAAAELIERDNTLDFSIAEAAATGRRQCRGALSALCR